ncbi:hypothetical protein [Streptomyces sp. NPDC051997]|uniref:hypothetical protein n=1 Tax=Streptomyces sp. NPDC051997 TaxID=3155611 RepID=UPI003419DB4D
MTVDPKAPSMRLWHRLLATGASEDDATELMHGYAHELADRQRAAIEGFDRDDHWGVLFRPDDVEGLPDLIDPKAQRATSEGDPT